VPEQRNPYKGRHPTPWVTLSFERADGMGTVERRLAVDTGDYADVRISSETMALVGLAAAPSQSTNFGPAIGGWVCFTIPELGIYRCTVAYATDQLVSAVRAISPDLDGQVGMAFLVELEYGGDAREFWIRS
jgi:hypothetical protein